MAMTYEKCLDIFGIRDIMSLPTRIMEILFGPVDQRNDIYRALLEANDFNVGEDWFQSIAEGELTEGKRKGQHFTPTSIYELLSEIVGTDGKNVHEPTAGDGGLIIGDWWNWCKKQLPWQAFPSRRQYVAWELSDRSVPILLLNLSIRGINATVYHGDVLESIVFQKYAVTNKANDAFGFSDVIRL